MLTLNRCDVSIILRAFSIFAIISGHLDLVHLTGGAYYLITLSGLNFVRFTLPKFKFNTASDESLNGLTFLKHYYRFLLKIIIPTCLYLILLHIALGNFHVYGLLLVSNFIGATYDGGLTYWFIEVLVQIYLLFSLLLMIKYFRVKMTNRPYEFFMALLFAAYAVSFLCAHFFDTSHLYNRLPHLLFYLFALGALTAYSNTPFKKSLTTIALVLVSVKPLVQNFGGSETFMFFALLATIWLPYVQVPKLLLKPINLIATSTLFIYLSHFQAASLIRKLIENPSPLLTTIFALIVGVIMSACWKNRFLVLEKSKKLYSSSLTKSEK